MVQAWYGHIWTKFWCFKYVDKVNLSTFSEYRHKLSIWADMECVGWETTVECSLSCLQGRLISPTPNPLKSSRIRLSATFAKLSAVPPQRMRINRRGNLGGALTRSLRENPLGGITLAELTRISMLSGLHRPMGNQNDVNKGKMWGIFWITVWVTITEIVSDIKVL